MYSCDGRTYHFRTSGCRRPYNRAHCAQKPAGSFLCMIFEHPDRHIPKNGGVFMRKIIWTLLLCLVVMPLRAATLQGFGDIERCWKVPYDYIPDGSRWAANCGGTVVGGDWFCAQESGTLGDYAESLTAATAETEVHCWCYMTYPYAGIYVYGAKSIALEHCNDKYGSCYNACARIWIGEYCEEKGYDSDCIADGYDGLFSTEDEQERFLRGLFATEIPENLCEIGISKLMVSTGDSFQLYAEKYTEHALVVQYKDQRCYLKLEEGKGGLNIMANDTIYHVVE